MGGQMALRRIIRLILLVVLVWRVAVYWDLLLRDWDGWKKLRKKGQKGKKREETTKDAKKTPKQVHPDEASCVQLGREMHGPTLCRDLAAPCGLTARYGPRLFAPKGP